jgi:cysteine-rich repeat protein
MPSVSTWIKALLVTSSFAFIACPADPDDNNDVEICDNGLDDDADGQADCADAVDCAANPFCAPPPAEICDNGADDDEDGQVDCDDANCAADPACAVCGDGNFAGGNEQCDDGNATDGDGCNANCQLESASTFTSAQDINGEQPDLAVFSIFGEAEVDTNGDGTPESRAILVISSDNADICGDITAGGLDTFINDLFGGLVAGETVATLAFTIGANTPFAVAPIVGDAGTTSIVDSGFLVAAGGAATVDTTFGGAGDGTLNVTAISATSLTADYTGNQQTEFVGGTQDINIGITGNIIATECPGITDNMQAGLGVVFGF